MKHLHFLSEILWTALKYLHSHPFLFGIGFLLGVHGSIRLVIEMETNQDSSQQQLIEQEFASYIQPYWEQIVIVIVIVAVFLLALWFLRAWMFSSIIYNTYAITKRRRVGFLTGFKRTYKSVWKILVLQFLFSLALSIIIVTLASPIAIFWGMQADGTAILLGTLAAVLFVSIGMILTLSFRFAMIYTILGSLQPRAALDAGYKLFTKKPTESGLFLTTLIGLEIITTLLLWLFPVLILNENLTLSIEPFMPIWMFGLYTLLAATLLTIFFSFKYVAWTIFFIRIAKQSDDKETEKIPEESVNKIEKSIEPIKNVE